MKLSSPPHKRSMTWFFIELLVNSAFNFSCQCYWHKWDLIFYGIEKDNRKRGYKGKKNKNKLSLSFILYILNKVDISFIFNITACLHKSCGRSYGETTKSKRPSESFWNRIFLFNYRRGSNFPFFFFFQGINTMLQRNRRHFESITENDR